MQLLNVTVSPARLQDRPPAVSAMIRPDVSLSGCGAVALAHEAKIANAITNCILVLLGTTPTPPSARGSAQWSRRSRRAAGAARRGRSVGAPSPSAKVTLSIAEVYWSFRLGRIGAEVASDTRRMRAAGCEDYPATAHASPGGFTEHIHPPPGKGAPYAPALKSSAKLRSGRFCLFPSPTLT